MSDSPARKESLSIPISKPSTDQRRASTARLAGSPFASGTPNSITNNLLGNNGPGSFSALYAATKRRNDSSSSSVILDDHTSVSNTPRGRAALINNRPATSNLNSRSSSQSYDDMLSPDDPSAHILGSSYGSTTLDDPNIMKNVNKHLSDVKNSLKLPGGDITRDLYQLSNKNSTSSTNLVGINGKPLRRSRSLTGSDLASLGERRGSTASQIRLPGGFRREFIASKKKFGYDLETPTFLTRNFLEFLSVYGHFAGEDLEDEDYLACGYYTDSRSSDEESSPLLTRRVAPVSEHKGTASTIKAFFLLLKSFIGTGVLFLPRAFSNGGLAFCILTLLLFGVLSYWCYLILVQTKIKTGVSSFGDIGAKLYGSNMKFLILTSIVISQIGFVAAYTVFTATNLQAFIKNFFNIELSIASYVAIECFILMPMSLVRNITKLSLAALLANIFILTGLVTIVYYSSIDLIATGPSEVKQFNPDSWSLFIGVAIFAFEGIGLIIPVQESMKHPEKYPLVLFAVILVCSILFIGVGSLGYITYGEDVQTVIILNLPQDSLAVNSIQLFYALAIMLSAPLQLLPAIRIIESRVFHPNSSGKQSLTTKWKKNIFRICIVITTTTIAYAGSENLDQFVSLVGSFACIPLVYMYPPMLHLRSCAESKWMKLSDILLTLSGGVAMVYTTYQILMG